MAQSKHFLSAVIFSKIYPRAGMYIPFSALFLYALAASLSHAAQDRAAFSRSAQELSDAEHFEAVIGRSLFERIWVSAPSSTQSTDGLGPLFNARSCAACHVRNGRGTPPLKELSNPSLLLRLGIPQSLPNDPTNSQREPTSAKPDPRYGKQLQTSAIPGFKSEARVRVTWKDKRCTNQDMKALISALLDFVFPCGTLTISPMVHYIPNRCLRTS